MKKVIWDWPALKTEQKQGCPQEVFCTFDEIHRKTPVTAYFFQ